MSSRFREEAGGLVSEALATQISVGWDPITDEARITFDSVRFLKVNSQYVTRMDSGAEYIEIDKHDLATRSYEINGKVISGGDLDTFVRLLYDELHNEAYGGD